MGDGDATANLALQLGAAAAMVVLMTLIHGLGLIGISKMLKLDKERLEELRFNKRAIGLICGVALLLFALHVTEIAVFAAFYLLIDAMNALEEALYYSASAYTTLGRTAEYFPEEWRLIGAIEALIGFLLIGWSTAFIVTMTNRLRR
ncbi:MAG: two pore domain potassium channel family protein [Pseudomonadota bacterium]|nr:two pore domain potassium channel family protein [Pseudomonadota bacterium]